MRTEDSTSTGPTTTRAAVVRALRERPGELLGWSLLVFVPLNAVRYLLNAAGLFPVALALTLVGHLVLVGVLWRRRERLGLLAVRPSPLVVVAWLVAITALEIVAGRGVDALVGRSAAGITVGGFLPALVLAPVWALVVVVHLRGREARP